MKSPSQGSVVVIEDDALNLELMQTVLEGGGYRVLGASDAPTGIALVRREHPAIVLMDVQLPEMDGLEATRILRADAATANIPVVAVTAHVKKDDEARCLEAGCVLHVSKPVDTRRLVEIVAGVIARSSAASAPPPLKRKRSIAAREGGNS
jgi:two-component system cell cycle response regulator DivK